ncbi:MAG: hypothetical protein N0A16_13175 [Blastocatellia bacterium]|nr:hypothetical protein [Blastocatellia bacterium]MDW8166909.1 hypothetical protein [Acidobacteriota bacterium]
MTTDEKVELAMKIGGQLVGITASEWSKWSTYATRYGLSKALRLAQTMKDSSSLRPGPKQSYRTIAEVVRRLQRDLEKLPHSDLSEVLGYVRWALFTRGS